MKRALACLLACSTLLTASAGATDANTPALAGHYYLQGITEVGSELLLKPDGTFQWMLSYGNTDQQASGDWRATGDQVTLSTANTGGKEPQFRPFTKEEMRVDKTVKQGVWAVIVGEPAIGPMPNVEVLFEAKSGKTATAVTDPSGGATVAMPASEQWVRAGLRRKDAKAAYQWLAVAPGQAQARVAAFAVTEARWVTPQAFQKLGLRVVKGGLQVSDAGNGLAAGLYARQTAK